MASTTIQYLLTVKREHQWHVIEISYNHGTTLQEILNVAHGLGDLLNITTGLKGVRPVITLHYGSAEQAGAVLDALERYFEKLKKKWTKVKDTKEIRPKIRSEIQVVKRPAPELPKPKISPSLMSTLPRIPKIRKTSPDRKTEMIKKKEVYLPGPAPKPFSNASRPLDKTRVFCLIPWADDQKTIEDEFFDQFAAFGLMDYYQIVPDLQGRPSYGFVQYYKSADAARAISHSHPKYGAQYAQARVRGPHSLRKRRHPPCGGLIHCDVYELHEKACAKQYRRAELKNSTNSPRKADAPAEIDEEKKRK